MLQTVWKTLCLSFAAYQSGKMTEKTSANSTVAASPLPFHGDAINTFNLAYFPIHGYLAIIVATFGILSNIVNVFVLSRKSMATPINAILTALAVTDGLVMLLYVPFAWHQFILRKTSVVHLTSWRCYEWMAFIAFFKNYCIVLHTVAVWLTITLAVFQYLAVTRPFHAARLCSMRRAHVAVGLAFLCTAIVCIPSYLTLQVEEVTDPAMLATRAVHDGSTIYMITESEYSKRHSIFPHRVLLHLLRAGQVDTVCGAHLAERGVGTGSVACQSTASPAGAVFSNACCRLKKQSTRDTP